MVISDKSVLRLHLHSRGIILRAPPRAQTSGLAGRFHHGDTETRSKARRGKRGGEVDNARTLVAWVSSVSVRPIHVLPCQCSSLSSPCPTPCLRVSVVNNP